MPPQLALELYHSIIQHIDSKIDLSSLALCCATFRDEAQQCLFRDAAPASLDRQIQFQSAINTAPLRLGPLVYSLYTHDWSTRDASDLVSSFSDALRAMHRLKHLKLYWQRPSAVLHGCSFQLQTLICGYLVEGQQVPFLLCDFIPTQSNIKRIELQVAIWADLPETPMGLCSQLESIGASDERLTNILLPDSRRISQFEWYRYNTCPPLTVHQLNHLQSLTLCIKMDGMDTSFAEHLSCLVNLEVHFDVSNYDHLFQNVSRSFLTIYVSDCIAASIYQEYSTSSSSPPSCQYFEFGSGRRRILSPIFCFLPADIRPSPILRTYRCHLWLYQWSNYKTHPADQDRGRYCGFDTAIA